MKKSTREKSIKAVMKWNFANLKKALETTIANVIIQWHASVDCDLCRRRRFRHKVCNVWVE